MQSRKTTGSLTAIVFVIAAIFLCRGLWIAGRPFPAPSANSETLPPAVNSTGFSRPPLWVDLNHDGRLDSVVVASEGHGGQTIQVKLDGAGNRELRNLDSQIDSRSVVYAADVDHDTNLDLVRESEDGFEPSIVWLGDGKGNFVLSSPNSRTAVDFYTLPRAPYRPSSSSAPQNTNWRSSTAAEKRDRSRILKPDTSRKNVATESRRRGLRHDISVRVRRELLLWIARTINAPPSPSLSA